MNSTNALQAQGDVLRNILLGISKKLSIQWSALKYVCPMTRLRTARVRFFSTPSATILMISTAAFSLFAPNSFGSNHLTCTEILPGELSQYGFHMRESRTYGDADLGRGTTYEDGSKTVRLSFYTYDLGFPKITEEVQMKALEEGYYNIVEASKMVNSVAGQPVLIASEYFQAMQTPLNIGLYSQTISRENAQQTSDEILAIGEYGGCIAKVRFTIPSGLNEELGDGDSLKLFYGLGKLLFRSLGE